LKEFKLVEEKLISIIEKDLVAKSELAAKSAQSTRNLLIAVAAMSALVVLLLVFSVQTHYLYSKQCVRAAESSPQVTLPIGFHHDAQG